ncbi:hypothetical protein QYF61_007840 [Mycteria americana]|uniref:Uncharacterized protein n=1 Tax=Mycteria americana TaxID=33587 RepID=A0AAN7NJH2_MYCAM|nr:hypothetical protein QYF61_007840 [Mycteria americana]
MATFHAKQFIVKRQQLNLTDSSRKCKIHTKQPRFPQPLTIRLVLQTLPQLRCPSLDTLQPLNVSLVVRRPKLNTVFEAVVCSPSESQQALHGEAQLLKGGAPQKAPLLLLPRKSSRFHFHSHRTLYWFFFLGMEKGGDINTNIAPRLLVTNEVQETNEIGHKQEASRRVSHVMVGGCLGQSDHEMIEFLIRREAARGVGKTATLDFRRADFSLFRRLVERVPWEAALMGKGVQEGWTFFKEEVLKAQERAVPRCRKTSRRGRRPAWLTRELWLELRRKRRVYDLWKKGRATQEDYKGVARLCREKTRRAKAELELSLAAAIKDNKKHFFKYISSKRRAKENL